MGQAQKKPIRKQSKEQSPFEFMQGLEERYARELRKIAVQIGQFVRGFKVNSILDAEALTNALRKYAELIRPWAINTASSILADVNMRDLRAWRKYGQNMSAAMQREIQNAPTGYALKQFLEENVNLITSLPLEAAERVHELTLQGLSDATRADEIAMKIMQTGEVTISRANLIARTEIARTSSGLVMVRAQSVGSEGYIWRTSRDRRVRESHRQMEGKFIRWNTLPTLSDGTVTHAGQIYNCRCYPEPVLPEMEVRNAA